jgi:2-dehydropantoate 2-reductase
MTESMTIQPIYILGIGNLGKLMAHSIRKYHPSTPITLLFHRAGLVDDWNRARQKIDIVNNGQSDPQGDFDYEVQLDLGDEIQNLVVATKTHSTLRALNPLRHRLSSLSTLLFLQNGIGTMDEVTAGIFKENSRRPHCYVGIVNHGVYATGPFSSVHAGFANMVLGPVLKEETISASLNSEPPFLLEKILECPLLNARYVSPAALFHAQLQKLVVNAIINPLTVIFDCHNGDIFNSPIRLTLIGSLVQEISNIMLAVVAAQRDSSDEITLDRFSATSLNEVVSDVGSKTSKNISSMRQDSLAGRPTEIDYINGYIVSQAALFGIQSPMNSRIITLVKQKQFILDSDIPKVFSL